MVLVDRFILVVCYVVGVLVGFAWVAVWFECFVGLFISCWLFVVLFVCLTLDS